MLWVELGLGRVGGGVDRYRRNDLSNEESGGGGGMQGAPPHRYCIAPSQCTASFNTFADSALRISQLRCESTAPAWLGKISFPVGGKLWKFSPENGDELTREKLLRRAPLI